MGLLGGLLLARMTAPSSAGEESESLISWLAFCVLLAVVFL
jgi:hypothetical protein